MEQTWNFVWNRLFDDRTGMFYNHLVGNEPDAATKYLPEPDMIHLLIPYMVLALLGVLQSIDPNVEYAAYSLGANPIQTFAKVVFPLSTPGIISGCVLVFTMSMTSYVTPKLLGGSKFRMMATMVVQEINVSFDWGAAAAISYILLAVILLIQLLVTLSTGKYMKRMGGGKNA